MMAQQQAPQQPPGPMPPQVQQGARPGPVVVTNVVFVVDTSASMNQRIYNGLSLLDCAKAAIEHFLKVRGRDLRFDRLFLLTFDDGPSGIKVGWGNDSFLKFTEEVKNLVATDLSAVGAALKRAFDLLNLVRFSSNFDNYGLGRIPWLPEPSVVILLTDGGALTSHTGVLSNLVLPPTPQPGSELTVEPFRWDQRLFSVLLRPPSTSAASDAPGGGAPSGAPVPNDPQGSPSSHLTAMSEVTGGKCYVATCMKTLLGCVESVVGRLNTGGLVVNFDRMSLADDPPTGLQLPASPHRLLFLRPIEGRLPLGNWPLPESFPPEAILGLAADQLLPARVAHPVLLVREVETEPYIYPGFPFDEYEVEPCPLTTALITQLSQSKTGQVCCQVYAANSGPGEPFGFIKAARSRKTGHKSVTLVVLPYNYPRLWPLLDELINTHRNMPNHKWRKEFDSYLARLPPYYFPYLRAAFKRYSFPVPEHIEDGYTNIINTHLQKIKLLAQQKYDAERMRGKTARSQSLAAAEANNSSNGEKWGVARTGLLAQVKQLQARLVFGLESEKKDTETARAHSVPIAHMGNYHEILRNQLRPIEEDPKRRAVFFGNPFVVARADKAGKMANMIDALDIEAASENEGLGAAGGAGLPLRSKKRKVMPSSLPGKPASHPPPQAKKPKLAAPTSQQATAAVGAPPASAVAPTPADDQTPSPPPALHQPSQAAQAEALAGALGVGGEEEEGELQEEPTSSPHPGVDLEGRLLAVDDLADDDEDDDEEGEEGELEGDQMGDEAGQEQRRPSLEVGDEGDEEGGEEGELDLSTDETESGDASANNEYPPPAAAAASEADEADASDSGSLLSRLFMPRPVPRHTQANSERRAALVSLIRQRRTDEEAVVRLVEEMEGTHDERRRHAAFALNLAQRWKKAALSSRLLPYVSA